MSKHYTKWKKDEDDDDDEEAVELNGAQQRGILRKKESNSGKVNVESNLGEAQIKVKKKGKPGNSRAESKRESEKLNNANADKKTGRTDDVVLDVEDYLNLLTLLHIRLPVDVLSPEVISLSKNRTSISDAKSIITELEDFKIHFCMIPRLACTKMKSALKLKKEDSVLGLTKIIFFGKTGKKEKKNKDIWKINSTNTANGFRMRDKYTKKQISTPKMHSSAIPKKHRDREPTVTKGVTVDTSALENTKYVDESQFNESIPKPFGKYHINKKDELECLKFVTEKILTSHDKEIGYTKGNKVDFDFLTGKVDFIANIQKSSRRAQEKSKKLVIECKGTKGDMFKRVFRKDDNKKVHLNIHHDYYYQTQAYMYTLNKQATLLGTPLSKKALMVVRHYHGKSNISPDFYSTYVQLNELIHKEIDELMEYCQTKVLACFLAVLDQIFKKEISDKVQ